MYIPPNDSKSLKVLFGIVEKLRKESLPVMMIGDFNAHHPYWFDSSANKLGNELHDFIVDKDLVILNNAEPTRKGNIIDLTIVSTSLSNKISDWKVQHEVYLNTDHNLVTFNIGEEEVEEATERLDFRNADWDKFEKGCSESLEEWMENRSMYTDINEDYRTFVEVMHKIVQENIPKKKICRHSKGWWSPRLTQLSKEFKKAKRMFKKRRDECNENKMKELIRVFKEEELSAKSKYLDEMTGRLDPRKPGEFWKVVNRVKNTNVKGVVQPIKREDGSLAVTDEEIFSEMKMRYGKETLDVKTYDNEWYNSVENEVNDILDVEQSTIKDSHFTDNCGFENSDIIIEEVEAAISASSCNSAPSPEEQIFYIYLKKGGDAVVRGLYYIIQKSWSTGVIPEAFKLDPKIMLPKPGKSDYNSVRSYRPITLESVLGKIMERVICKRLVWKLEVEEGVAKTQYAYRRQKSCVQTLLRICNSISEARSRKESTVLTVMDFESCYERVWRAGLLKKAEGYGIKGRLWIYIRNFLTDRRYFMKVNGYTSPVFVSAVGIPQGSVISPVLCNVYTSDAMEGIEGGHAEFADDNCVWNSYVSLLIAFIKTNGDLSKMDGWCLKWNMSIAPEKTDVLLFTPGSGEEIKDDDVNVEIGGMKLKRVKSKKILGVVVDDKLSFNDHIKQKTSAAFRALKGLDVFVDGMRGCSQSTYMKMYKALVLPILEYGSPVTVGAITECCKEFNKVQRSAMLKATGCVSSTSTETLEILTNTLPIDLHLKLRQAQEVIRIAAKHNDDPLKEEFEDWMESNNTIGRKPTIFQLLMSRFREMKGSVEFDKIEKEFRYSRDCMGMIKEREIFEIEEFTNSKEEQEENIRDFLSQSTDQDVLLFTDGSALGNPGPTGAGAVAYIDGYKSSPVLLKKGVSPISNNYTGELVGIQIGLEFISELENIQNRPIHILTDCQPAIKTAFGNHLPKNKIEIVFDIKNSLGKIWERNNKINVHWVPGHKEIEGNELADKQAKEAASEMSKPDVSIEPVFDKTEAVSEIKKQMTSKWNLKFSCSENSNNIQDIFSEVGKRNCYGEWDRPAFSTLNQLLSGHSILNGHRAKFDKNISYMCESCQVLETVDHFLFHCEKYKTERDRMERTVENVLFREGCTDITCIDLRLLGGNDENLSRNAQNDVIAALMEFIRCSNRF